MLPALPVELWERILRQATYIDSEFDVEPLDERRQLFPQGLDVNTREARRVARKTRTAIVLVCTTWKLIGDRFLYETFDIVNDVRVARFAQTLRANPALARHVRRLSIFATDRLPIDDPLDLCPNITHCFIYQRSWPAALGFSLPFRLQSHGLQKLQHISLNSIMPGVAHDCATVLSPIQSLVSLEICGGHPTYVNGVDYYLPFPHVKTLKLRVNPQWIPVLNQWHFPSLQFFYAICSPADGPDDSLSPFIQHNFVNLRGFALGTLTSDACFKITMTSVLESCSSTITTLALWLGSFGPWPPFDGKPFPRLQTVIYFAGDKPAEHPEALKHGIMSICNLNALSHARTVLLHLGRKDFTRDSTISTGRLRRPVAPRLRESLLEANEYLMHKGVSLEGLLDDGKFGPITEVIRLVDIGNHPSLSLYTFTTADLDLGEA